MSKEKYLEELSDELRISKPVLKKFIYAVGTNKENIKDYAKNGSCGIVRKDNGFDVSYVAQMLNEKDAKIKDLEHRLSNCIEPKFKIGQEIWDVVTQRYWEIKKFELIPLEGELCEMYRLGHGDTGDYNSCLLPYDGNQFFATEEEAKAKLEEIQNANN